MLCSARKNAENGEKRGDQRYNGAPLAGAAPSGSFTISFIKAIYMEVRFRRSAARQNGIPVLWRRPGGAPERPAAARWPRKDGTAPRDLLSAVSNAGYLWLLGDYGAHTGFEWSGVC